MLHETRLQFLFFFNYFSSKINGKKFSVEKRKNSSVSGGGWEHLFTATLGFLKKILSFKLFFISD